MYTAALSQAVWQGQVQNNRPTNRLGPGILTDITPKILFAHAAYAFGLRPGLPNLLKAINKKVLQYQSDGTIFRLYNKWWIPADGACDPKRKVATKTG